MKDMSLTFMRMKIHSSDEYNSSIHIHMNFIM
jgi:hypothetical protein